MVDYLVPHKNNLYSDIRHPMWILLFIDSLFIDSRATDGRSHDVPPATQGGQDGTALCDFIPSAGFLHCRPGLLVQSLYCSRADEGLAIAAP